MKNKLEILTLAIALFGAVAWLQQPIFNYFSKADIHGRIISQYVNKLENRDLFFIHKLSIFSKNKNFYLKGIKAFIKFPGSEKEWECKPWTMRKVSFELDENGKMVRKQLQTDKIEYLLHYTILPKNQSIVGYFLFTVSYSKDEPFDYIRYIFEDYSGNILELKKTKVDLPENEMFFDDNIWK